MLIKSLFKFLAPGGEVLKRALLVAGVLAGLGFQSCRTYYVKNKKFNEHFAAGRIEEADKVIGSDKKSPKRNGRLLYFLNRGVVSSMLGRYEESNKHFDTALVISETIQKNYALQAAGLLTNPYLLPYKGENFELLLVHYYKAINYLHLKRYDDALVECRQVDIKLGQLGDKYKKDNRYKRDAFLHTLMGIIYEADGDYNNAFIAYRNAIEIYEKDYLELYKTGPPEQLRHDLIRAAYKTGFHDEVDFYEKKYNLQYKPEDPQNGQLVFFWLNGLGPVKDEWNINFIINRQYGANMVYFENADLGWSFPFYYKPDNNDSGFAALEFIKLSLPRYLERPPVYSSAKLIANSSAVHLETVEPVSQIAHQSLQDRIMRELGQSLLRLAMKKAAEYSARQQNQNAGAALGIVNFLTEHADTRNWQTLPHSISYARMSLPPGEQEIKIEMNGMHYTNSTQTFKYNIKAGQTTFQSYHSLNALPPVLFGAN